MAKGSRGGVRRARGGGGIPASAIRSEKDMISSRHLVPEASRDMLQVASDVYDEYGENIGQFVLADIDPRYGALAYFSPDNGNVGLNTRYVDAQKMNQSYDDCVKSGFHPGRGGKTGTEAVAAHELGHALTDAAAKRMGYTGSNGFKSGADRIVGEARKLTSHRGVVQMASKISGYATASNAEAIAEAFADCYCNGSKAKAESKAIKRVLDSYLH